MGKDAADDVATHQAEMHRQREARGRLMNSFLAFVVMTLSLLIIASAIAGVIALFKAVL